MPSDFLQEGVEERYQTWAEQEWPINRGEHGCHGSIPEITIETGLDPRDPLGIGVDITEPQPTTVSFDPEDFPPHCGGDTDPRLIEQYKELDHGGIETSVDLGGSYCKACNHVGTESLEVMAQNNQAFENDTPQQSINNPAMG